MLDLTNRKSEEELALLPRPANDLLRKLFEGIDKVVFKDGGVCKAKAMDDKVMLTLSDQSLIATFASLLELNEEQAGFYCLCLGDYAIELFAGNLLVATIGLHHGVSIRYDRWNSDVELAKGKELLHFLSEQGFTQPLQDWLEQERRSSASAIEQRDWLHVAPKFFSKHINEINGWEHDIPILLQDLNEEIPDKSQQIIALLQAYGKTKKFWSGYPSYEDAPRTMLLTFPLQEIIEVYLQSDRNYKTRRGLGRYVCNLRLKSKQKKQLKHIPDEVFDDLEKCFLHIGEESGVERLLRLKKDRPQPPASS